MSIITISHDSYSQGEEIAESVAKKLGYECIGPEIIQIVCNSLNSPSFKIKKALNDSPTFLEHITAKKEQYLSMFRAIFFEYMCRDNIVYYGRAGHIFLADVPRVIKARIIDSLNDRISRIMDAEDLSYKGAKRKLGQEDKKRNKWTKYLYGIDNHDPRLYDFYLNLRNISLNAAVDMIISTSCLWTKEDMELSKRRLRDMALAARAEAKLREVFPEVSVDARDGEVFVTIQGSILQEELIIERAREIISKNDDFHAVKISVAPSIYVPF